jgi:hypothetical protein
MENKRRQGEWIQKVLVAYWLRLALHYRMSVATCLSFIFLLCEVLQHSVQHLNGVRKASTLRGRSRDTVNAGAAKFHHNVIGLCAVALV